MSQPVFGNYQGYYQKRPAICDPRLSLFRQSFFENKHVLDVGCNEGWVSIEIAQRWGAARVIGVDIDHELVAGAWKRRRTVWSVQSPPTEMSRLQDAPCPENQPFPIDYYPASLPYMYGPLSSLSDQMEQTPPHSVRSQQPAVPRGSDGVVSSNLLQSPVPLNGGDSYFPLSLVQSFGPMPLLPAEERRETRFPHNVIFRAADWVEHGVPEDEGGYDVILAFSVSKWIHLNGGDEGLVRFFRRVWDSLRPGGKFILEAQAWDGYAKAKRMHPRLKESYAGLQLRPEGFEQVLRDIGFSAQEEVGITGEGGFRRPVDMYTRPTQ